MQARKKEASHGLRTAIEIPVSSLGTENQQSPDCDIDNNAHCTGVPYHRVTNEVDLTMVLDPKVLKEETLQTSSQENNISKLTIPRRRKGQESGRESKVCRSVKPAFVVHMTC